MKFADSTQSYINLKTRTVRDNVEVEGQIRGEEKGSVSDWTANFLVKRVMYRKPLCFCQVQPILKGSGIS